MKAERWFEQKAFCARSVVRRFPIVCCADVALVDRITYNDATTTRWNERQPRCVDDSTAKRAGAASNFRRAELNTPTVKLTVTGAVLVRPADLSRRSAKGGAALQI
jgi:hypothetical protein